MTSKTTVAILVAAFFAISSAGRGGKTTVLGSAAVSTSYSSAAAIVSNPKAKKYGISCDLIRSRKINQLKLNGGSTVGGLEMSVRGGGGTTFLSGWEDGSDNDESGHLYEERDGDRDEGKGNEFKESGGDECEKGGGEDEEEERQPKLAEITDKDGGVFFTASKKTAKLLYARLWSSKWWHIFVAVLIAFGQRQKASFSPRNESGTSLGTEDKGSGTSMMSGILNIGPNPRHFSFEVLNERYKGDADAVLFSKGVHNGHVRGKGAMESLCELCRTLAKNFTNSMQNCNPTANKITGPQFPSELQQEQRKVLYVVEFKPSKNQNDCVSFLAEVANFLVQYGNSSIDEVLVVIESPGGEVTDYGLASEQLARIRRSGLPLTCCVDKVAASGGYMMAAVATKLLCSPFAIVGSIGVLSRVVNLRRLAEKRGVDVVTITGGKWKESMSVLSEVSPDSMSISQTFVNEVHDAFKDHIQLWRPQIDIHEVSTGRVWIGTHALSLGLVDEVTSSDEYIQHCVSDTNRTVLLVKQSSARKYTFSEVLRRLFSQTAAQSGGIFCTCLDSSIRYLVETIQEAASTRKMGAAAVMDAAEISLLHIS